jgi:formylmethanofuran:tetrahydromethanopterin formyltransferase
MIHNANTSAVPAVQDVGGTDSPVAGGIPSGGSHLTTITHTEQYRLQTFPASGFNEVLTLTLSVESVPSGFAVVGQMLSGNG